ncbi:MAG: insulinase family protein, partial [Bdellovibrionota bacterium]
SATAYAVPLPGQVEQLKTDPNIEDPFAHITKVKALNGITLIFAPSASAKTFKIKVQVKTGFQVETPSTAGISHLLEHYLFTDARLKDDLTYLEVIKEKGGSANGWTGFRETVYHATIPGKHAQWLVKTFANMVFDREFDDVKTEHAKKPVLLEIGEPMPFAAIWNLGLYEFVYPQFLNDPDFWQSEFGINENREPRFREQLNTYKFRASDLRRHYLEYYHPGNITVYFAGKFDAVALQELALHLFGREPPRVGKTIPEPNPVPRAMPYVRTSSTSGTPFVSVGTKFWDFSLDDYYAIELYLEYAAHRLQKELRNKQGKTYSVRKRTSYNKDFGYGALALEVPADDYSRVVEQVRDLIRKETGEKALTRTQFEEARKLYSSHFTLTDKDASTYLWLAEWMTSVHEMFEKPIIKDIAWSIKDEKMFEAYKTPYMPFASMTYEDWVKRLHYIFAKDRLFFERTEPTVLFRLEKPVFILIFLAFFFYSARFFASRNFMHSRIRMVRKLTYPPLFLGELSLVLLGLALSRFLIFLVDRAFLAVPWLQSTFIVSDYLNTLIDFGVASATCLFFLISVVRKVIVCSDALYLKKISYASERISWGEIDFVRIVSPWKILSSWKLLKSVMPRVFYFDPLFWRPGLLITLKDGRSYFLGVRKAGDAEKDIRRFVSKKVHKIHRPGAKIIPFKRAA